MKVIQCISHPILFICTDFALESGIPLLPPFNSLLCSIDLEAPTPLPPPRAVVPPEALNGFSVKWMTPLPRPANTTVADAPTDVTESERDESDAEEDTFYNIAININAARNEAGEGELDALAAQAIEDAKK